MTREQAEALKLAIDKIRRDALCEVDTVAEPIAEQHFLLALAALDQAARYMQLAGYYVSRGE